MEREKYFNCFSHTNHAEMVPRVLYELGLLTVKQVHKDHTITLGSPNTDVYRRGVEVMSSKTVLTAPPPKEDVLKLLTLQNLQKVMDKAAEEINYSYFGFGNKLREYAIQDAIFRQLQVLFPPLNKKTSDFLFKIIQVELFVPVTT